MAGVKRSVGSEDNLATPSKVRKHQEANKSISIDIRSLECSSFPKFQKPQELVVFSTVSSPTKDACEEKDEVPSRVTDKYSVTKPCLRTLSHDATSNLQELVLPHSLDRLSFDLNKGYGTQIEKNDENEFMNILLKAIDEENLVGRSDFVCWRGLLTRIGASPYDAGGRFDDGCKIVAQKVGPVIYMYEFPTEQSLKKKEAADERQKLMQYWGMKFESYLTARPGNHPDTDVPLNFNLEYGSVVSTKLGCHSLVFGGEVDCSFQGNPKRYAELKTTREFSHEGQKRSFRKFKLLKWWLQSFLIGIDGILCGFRDDEGFVKRCNWFKVSEISRIIKEDRDHWKPAACLTFLNLFLDFLQKNVTKDHIPHILTRQPGHRTFNMTVDESGTDAFLPKWYLDKYAN